MTVSRYPMMNRRMKIGQIPIMAMPVFKAYRDKLVQFGTFDLDDFITELKCACKCNSDRSTHETLSVLWNATRDPALVYYLDNLESKPIEFELFVARSYGRHGLPAQCIESSRIEYWKQFYNLAAGAQQASTA